MSFSNKIYICLNGFIFEIKPKDHFQPSIEFFKCFSFQSVSTRNRRQNFRIYGYSALNIKVETFKHGNVFLCKKQCRNFLIGSHMWLGGCPNPSKIEQCWKCTFLNLYAHVKTKWASKKFHFWPSEIPANMCGQSSLDLSYRPCTPAAISEGQKWKTLLMLILSSHGHRGFKNCIPKIVQFC